jgi:hypothetical protein
MKRKFENAVYLLLLISMLMIASALFRLEDKTRELIRRFSRLA